MVHRECGTPSVRSRSCSAPNRYVEVQATRMQFRDFNRLKFWLEKAFRLRKEQDNEKQYSARRAHHSVSCRRGV